MKFKREHEICMRSQRLAYRKWKAQNWLRLRNKRQTIERRQARETSKLGGRVC